MTYLLDVNVLVAIADRDHVHHDPAHRWFQGIGESGWATSATTELGFIQVLSNPAYPGWPQTPDEAAERLTGFCDTPRHTFWPDDLPPRNSLADDVRRRLRGHRHVTDFHLAALAARHGGRFVTFDRRLARALEGTGLGAAVLVVA